MDSVISEVSDTLLISKESLSTKLDAISLLVTIVLNFNDDYQRNISIFENLYEKREEIETVESADMLSNINKISLKIGLQLLYTAMGKDTYLSLLELFPYLRDDIPTIISVVSMISKYLDNNTSVKFPKDIEIVILQNVLQWICSDNLDIRWSATKIILALLRNPDNKSIINNKLINLVDTENAYIKNLIMRNVYLSENITETTRNYILSKSEIDANYVVRLVCSEVNEKYKL